MPEMDDNDQFFQMEKDGLFRIEYLSGSINFSDSSRYKKLSADDLDTLQLHGLISQMPMAATSAASSHLCLLTFPKGVMGALTRLKQGGYGTMLKGADGKFVGTASIYLIEQASVVMKAFTVMSIASSQYFLAKINNQLTMINQKIDNILGFLYGDKKAELLSELSYAKRAYDNYRSLMSNEYQRTATIIGIQQSGKVALKDMEFYIQDLHNVIGSEAGNSSHIGEVFENAMMIRDSLNLSLQLYVMCCMLEIYYSQNTDSLFISNLEHELVNYIEKCNSRVLSDLSVLKTKLITSESSVRSKIPFGQKYDTNKDVQTLTDIIDSMHDGETLSIRNIVHESMKSITNEVKFCIDVNNKEVYYIAA